MRKASEEASNQIEQRRRAAQSELDGLTKRIGDLQRREADITQRVSELRSMFANAFAGFGLGVDNAHSTDNMSVVNAFVESDNDADADTDVDDADSTVLIDDHAQHAPTVPPAPTMPEHDDAADAAAPHAEESATEVIDVTETDTADDADDAPTTAFDASDNDPDATQLTD